MNKTFLYPYKDGSASAKALAQALGIKRVKREGSHFKPSGKTVINWGCSKLPDNIVLNGSVKLINPEYLVAIVSDKLRFFKDVDEECHDLIVPWTTSPDNALNWLADGKRVVCRRILTGHSGEGIEIIKGEHAELPIVPLYTLYTPKKHEYRIHCYRNKYGGVKVFDIQQKKRKTGVADDNVDWQVRNLNGGFIYARNDIDVPSCVTDVALKVFEATGLDFGAVDIIYSQKHDRAYALEVNTAPGLSGTTLDNYVEMFKELLA